MKNPTGNLLRSTLRNHPLRTAIILAAALFSIAVPGQSVHADPLPAAGHTMSSTLSGSTAGMQTNACIALQGAAARSAQDGSAPFPIAYVVVIYLGIILVAIGIEIFIAFLMIRFIFEIVLFPPWKIILSVTAINAITIPGAVFLTELLSKSASIPHLFAVLLTEIATVVIEALWYRRTLSLHSGNALLLSLIANMMSYIFGVILFGY